MAVKNGGLVVPVLLSEEKQYFSKYTRHLLVNNKRADVDHYVDRIVLVCPDFAFLLEHFRGLGMDRVVTYIRGRVRNIILLRYMLYLENPQHFSHRPDLIFSAHWIVCI